MICNGQYSEVQDEITPAVDRKVEDEDGDVYPYPAFYNQYYLIQLDQITFVDKAQ